MALAEELSAFILMLSPACQVLISHLATSWEEASRYAAMLFSLVKNRALSLTFLSLLASSSVAEVFEKLPGVPEGWHVDGTPRDDQPIRLQVALHQPNVAAFEQSVIDMSTPGHPNYGKHFETYDQMKRMLLPSSAAVHAVVGWLESSNITDIKVDADWVTFQTTIERANALLNTEFMWYESDAHHVRRVRTLEYSVPKSVAPHINMIQPTTRFGHLHPNRATSRANPQLVDGRFRAAAAASSKETDCNTAITPQCLKSLYKIGDYNASSDSGSRIGFGSFLQQYARYSDLELFEENIAPYATGQNFSVVSFNGGLNDQSSLNDSAEANLDAQYIVGVTSRLPVTEYTTGGLGPLVPDLSEPTQADDQNEPYLEFLQALLNSSSLPQVLSISYGEDEQTIPPTYARTVCNLFAQLGSRGVSVIFASGDSGVGSGCESNDGTNQTRFLPQFPATCPWVTAVGATRHIAPESAAAFSSGGFSDLWPRPAWQDSAVKTYLNGLGDQFQGLFNASGRGFPDVAAQGVGFAVYDKGSLISLEGTSCSAPVFSGVVALLNDARLKANQSSLGFLNPWLYSAGYRGLNDIVDGGSSGCDGSKGGPVVPDAGWNATRGWDPVTGLGTPNFPALLKLALAQNQTRVTSAGRSIRHGRW